MTHLRLIVAVIFVALAALAVTASVIEWRGEPLAARPQGATAPRS